MIRFTGVVRRTGRGLEPRGSLVQGFITLSRCSGPQGSWVSQANQVKSLILAQTERWRRG